MHADDLPALISAQAILQSLQKQCSVKVLAVYERLDSDLTHLSRASMAFPTSSSVNCG